MQLSEAQSRERDKYLYLKTVRPSYGGSFHGQDAVAPVADMSPRCVVDFGCGRNDFARALRERGIEAIGVDWVYDEADVKAAMHDTGLKSGVADVVTSFDALEHLLPDEVPVVLREMRRVCRQGGRFIFSISTRPSRITARGENLHPTVRPIAWWREQIERVGVLDDGSGLRFLSGRFR